MEYCIISAIGQKINLASNKNKNLTHLKVTLQSTQCTKLTKKESQTKERKKPNLLNQGCNNQKIKMLIT